ncbi:STAS domain-containing protein [Streptacidiphilus albus]|uniref:STAS domain-containing protein n=1 Tax=Streptacidiphilus albus TaxID=105425 RepID=UPI00054B1A1C|nr:STAS domain-containing protein [Streptacidiphilus albus]
MTPDPRGTDAAFAVESHRAGAAAVLVLTGELDHTSAPLLSEALRAALGGADVDLVAVDCAQLTFCDSTGLNTLLMGRADARAQDVGLRLAGLPRMVARLFEITGADTVFEIYPGREEALGAR